MGASVTGVICRDWDDNTAWTAASDGALEKRAYLPQNWRADVVNVVQSTGLLIQSLRYSSYGVPIGLPSGDTDSDGDCDSTDTSQIQTWINAAAYDVRRDLNLDGSVNATDKTIANTYFVGETLGYGSAFVSTFNGSKGYGGYELTSLNQWIAQRRTLLSDLGIWARRDPLGFAGGYNPYQYVDGGPLRYLDTTGLKKCEGSVSVINPPIDAEVPFFSGTMTKQFMKISDFGPAGMQVQKTFSQVDGNTCSVQHASRANLERYTRGSSPASPSKKELCDDACWWHGESLTMQGTPCTNYTTCSFNEPGWPQWEFPPQLLNFTEFFTATGVTGFIGFDMGVPGTKLPGNSSEQSVYAEAESVPCLGFESAGTLVTPHALSAGESSVSSVIRAKGFGGNMAGQSGSSSFAKAKFTISCGSNLVQSQIRSKNFPTGNQKYPPLF